MSFIEFEIDYVLSICDICGIIPIRQIAYRDANRQFLFSFCLQRRLRLGIMPMIG